MGSVRAAAGSVLFLGLAPGVVAGLVPWLLTGWSSAGTPAWLQAVGWVALAAGAAVLFEAFGRFVVEGVGTPAPAAPTENLVVGGLYRYVRNPMYLAVAAVILGQAAVLGRWLLVVYAVAFGATVWSFVHWYEEPTLRRQFGTEYDEYLSTVPGWWPPTSTGADWLNAPRVEAGLSSRKFLGLRRCGSRLAADQPGVCVS